MKQNNSINPLQEAYDRRGKQERISFRRAVCMKCDWSSDGVFYRKKRGSTPITALELDAIKRLDKQLA